MHRDNSLNSNKTVSENKLKFVLKQLMEKTNLRDADLCRTIGMSQSTLHQLLNAKSISPRIDTIWPIAQYFNVRIEQLIGHEPLDGHNISSEHSLGLSSTNTNYIKKDWNSALYLKCVEITSKFISNQSKIIDADKAITIINEIYYYSLAKGKGEVDKEFAEWFVTRSL